MIKSWIGFGDLDLIVRINLPKLNQKVFVCLHVISWTIGWYVTRFASVYKSDRKNSLLDFGEPDLIFKVTAS